MGRPQLELSNALLDKEIYEGQETSSKSIFSLSLVLFRMASERETCREGGKERKREDEKVLCRGQFYKRLSAPGAQNKPVFHVGEINFPESPPLGFWFANATMWPACSLCIIVRIGTSQTTLRLDCPHLRSPAQSHKSPYNFMQTSYQLFPTHRLLSVPQPHIMKSRFGESVAAKRHYDPTDIHKRHCGLWGYYFE